MHQVWEGIALPSCTINAAGDEVGEVLVEEEVKVGQQKLIKYCKAGSLQAECFFRCICQITCQRLDHSTCS